MKLKEYLEREPTGEAFLEVVDWMRGKKTLSSPVIPYELAAKQREAILRHGGWAVGIRVKGADMNDL